MAEKLLMFNMIILVFGIIAQSVAQYWHQGYNYPQIYQQPYQQISTGRQKVNYQTQNEYENNPWLPQGVSIKEADWICKNSKTGDMMIISSQDEPLPKSTPNLTPNKLHQPHIDPTPTESTHVHINSTNSIVPNNSNNSKEPQPSQDTSDTNGEGLIDIRLGPN